jgi:hypothetical protein
MSLPTAAGTLRARLPKNRSRARPTNGWCLDFVDTIDDESV